MTSWPVERLGALCDIKIGKTPSRARPDFWGPGFPWLSIADMNQGRELVCTKESITERAVLEANHHQVVPGTVLMSFKLSIGKIGVARVPMYTNEAIAHLPVKNKGRLLPEYLCWALSAADLGQGADRAAMGSTLNSAKLRDITIPVPPIEEQRRIAEVLDSTEALRAKRREAIVQLDTLTQSIFLDMFGDPITNPRGWPIAMLGEVGTLDRGVSQHRPRNAPHLLGGSHPLVQTGDVANSGGYIRRHVSSYSDAGLRQSKLWPKGTLCITIAANIAKTGILTFDACFPDSVVGFRAEESATVEFVRVWLSFIQKALEESAPESAQKNINLAILRSLKIPFPPVALRRAFASRLIMVEQIRDAHRRSLTHLETLVSSLQHRAFRGEL